MAHFERKISSESIYKGRIVELMVDVAELEDNTTAIREVIVHPGGVGVLAIDTQGQVLMVRQFRYPTGKELLEIPAGKLEFGEDPLLCGHRELEEETGYKAEKLHPLTGMFPTPAYNNEYIHLYYAAGLVPSQQNLDSQEFLSVEKIPFDSLLEMVLRGEIIDGKTQSAVMQYACLKNMGRV